MCLSASVCASMTLSKLHKDTSPWLTGCQLRETKKISKLPYIVSLIWGERSNRTIPSAGNVIQNICLHIDGNAQVYFTFQVLPTRLGFCLPMSFKSNWIKNRICTHSIDLTLTNSSPFLCHAHSAQTYFPVCPVLWITIFRDWFRSHTPTHLSWVKHSHSPLWSDLTTHCQVGVVAKQGL